MIMYYMCITSVLEIVLQLTINGMKFIAHVALHSALDFISQAPWSMRHCERYLSNMTKNVLHL